MEKLPQTDYKDSIISSTKDLTTMFELKTSSRQSMITSLQDNSTETFWESGNEDRNKIKHITINKCSENIATFDNYEIKISAFDYAFIGYNVNVAKNQVMQIMTRETETDADTGKTNDYILNRQMNISEMTIQNFNKCKL